MESLLERLGWHEWLCHTNFSFLTGASHPHECVDRAMALGYRGLTVTDFDGVYGLARSHLHWRRARTQPGSAPVSGTGTAPMRLHYGMELHLARDHDLPVIFRDTLALVATSRRGYHHLCRLASLAHREGKAYACVSLEELLAQPVDGLVAIQPMRGLIRRIPGGGAAAAAYRERCGRLAEHFKGRLHLAVSRHLNPGEDAWITPTIRLAKALNLPCLLSQDVFFHEPSRKDLSDMLQAIRTNLTLEKAVSQMFVNSERSLHDLPGIARRFGDLPVYAKALTASAELAAGIDFSMDELRYHYPKEMIPEGHTAQGWLEAVTWKAAKERYGDPLPGRITATLAHELDLIKTLNFADYFLTVWDIVRWARSQNIVCQGRGSAANSAVCFILGITAVDPSLFDLLFERFVSVERGDPPDIDVDFEHERREEVIQYIYSRYGRERAAMVANVITYRSRGALRAVGRALGVPDNALGEVARVLSERHFRRSGAENVLDAARLALGAPPGDTPQLIHNRASVENPVDADDSDDNDLELDAGIPWSTWATMAERLKGFPRHLGIHSGGFMLADVPLDTLVAQEPATMPGRSVIQWCKEDIEGLGFFKIDILALGMLTAVRKCLASLKEHYGVEHTLATIPQEDPATYAMIQRADTVGTFQIESRAQMSMLPRLRPRTFYDLVIEVAIIRPGPIQGGMIHPFLKRRNGQEPVRFPDQRLRPILARTLGIPLFQEQVMRIAIAVGGFTPGEANELRRHMGAWTIKGDMGPWLPKLANGMRANGIGEDFVQTILEQMKGFAHYGFPESHAVSFALIAYASSWLKCHYPAPFFQSLLNSQPMGFYSAHALLQAAGRDGVKILPVCVNRSAWDCTLEQVTTPGRPPVWALRLGFRLVTALRRQGADALIAGRAAAGGSFKDLPDMLRHAALIRSDLTALAAADALRVFDLGRKPAVWIAEAAPFCPVLEDVEDPVEFASESTLERIQLDFAATGTSLGPHPSAVIRREHWCYPVPLKALTAARDLAKVPAGRMVHVFGMVLVRQAPPSARGMVFFTLEDETGFINLAFTPEMYAKFHRVVERQAFLCLKARVQRQNESHSLMVTEVHAPQAPKAEIRTLIPADPAVAGQGPTPPAAPAAATGTDPAATMRELAPSRNYM